MKFKNKKPIQRKKYHQKRLKELVNVEKIILEKVKDVLKRRLKLESPKMYIGIYWPLNGEIDLRSLRYNLDVRLALPSCNQQGEIIYRPWTDNDLQKDACGIPAPLTQQALEPSDISTLFIPAIAIDKQGVRLGNGGGFYDRLRRDKLWRSISSFVVLPKCCVSDIPLPRDPWDIPFKSWITEDGECMTN